MPSLPFILAALLDGGGGQNAHMLMQLLPRGRLWRLIPEAILSKALLASADEIDRVDQRVADLLNEDDPSTAVELLPEYERELALAAAPTTVERQANIVGRLVRRQRFRPVDFQEALAALLQQDAADVVVLERSVAFCASIGDAREIFRFFVFRDPALPGAAFIASAQALVSLMKPRHTVGAVIEAIALTFDDPHSLFDRDLLGAIPAFVSASVPVVTRSTSLVVAAPAGTAAGDTVLLLGWASNDAVATPNLAALPAGWSVLSSVLTGAGRRVLLLRRIATGSEPASHTFPCSADGASVVNGVALAYRSLDPLAALVDSGVADAASTVSFTAPAVTLSRSSDLYVGFAWGNNNTATSTAPAGTVERVNASATQDGFTHCEAFDLQPLIAGAVGPETSTFSIVNSGVAASYVLRAQVRF